MKRHDGLYEISRRSFVALAGAGGVGLVVACNSSMDATVDAPPTTPDAATSGACSTSGVDVGASSTYSMNTPVVISAKGLVIVRDSGGLYAMSSACTHQGQTLCVGSTTACSSSGTSLYCTRHGAAFSFTGAVVRGPATTALPHYAMCLLANGNLGVLKSTIVPATMRFSG
jgi:nitrite reductase/ring-hydroxylating ferredoxin subunit